MVDKLLTYHRYQVGDGYEIALAEAGEGPVVVFLHGSGPGASGSSNFKQNVQDFVNAGFSVLVPDLIGYGASSKPEGIDYTLDLFVNTIFEALKQHGVTKAHLVGNSLGGGIAIQLALDNPDFVDRLVLMAPGCIEELPVYFAMPGIANMRSSFGSPDFSEADQRRLGESLVYDPIHITDELVAERFAIAKIQPKDVLARMKTPNLAPRLHELKMPIQLFWGYNERFMPLTGIDYFMTACPDVRCTTFNQVGHWVQVERSDEFNQQATAFLHG